MSLVVAVLGGCASDSMSPTSQRGTHYSTQEVIAAFKCASDDQLRIDPDARSVDGDRDILSFREGAAATQIPPRFGESTAILESRCSTMLPHKTCEQRWWYSAESGGWVTGKCYGSNVFLSWVAGAAEEERRSLAACRPITLDFGERQVIIWRAAARTEK